MPVYAFAVVVVQPGIADADRRRLAGLMLLSLRDRYEDLTNLTFALLRWGGRRRQLGNTTVPKTNRRQSVCLRISAVTTLREW